jgi:MSHA pilin protein MshD
VKNAIHRQRAFSLIEVVFALVVLSVGVVAFLTLINQSVRHSADPMVLQQANAIAQSYLEEALLNPFCDPDNFSTDCPSACTASNACTACSTLETSSGNPDRPNFDDVCDYGAINDTSGARSQNGTAITGLEDYNVDVVVDDSGVVVSGVSSATGGVVRIDVTVTHDSIPSLNLTVSGYRTNF